ncbi:hypothetical protein LIER_00176 [Lithospermum erythrorhizon]|uniref:Retrovirus-related Pol polyprotein from transposon TNT 1-94-like beta-barrel domain-containing protein n=1 Tax=Lithospermum erythrorhizon TaxID=34254 RepID=A0AAV3NGG6_LITER
MAKNKLGFVTDECVRPLEYEQAAQYCCRKKSRGVFPGAGRGLSYGHPVGRGMNSFYCDHCKMVGHSVQKCYKWNGYPNAPRRVAAHVGEKSLTDDQFNKLVGMLNSTSISEGSAGSSSAMAVGNPCCFNANSLINRWILDTGATYHITPHLSLFKTYNTLSHVAYITIPDGTQVAIEHVGTVHISNHLVLHNVLHVPQFKFNLLSIQKLCIDLSATVSFNAQSSLL